jgi:hypothetical protein
VTSKSYVDGKIDTVDGKVNSLAERKTVGADGNTYSIGELDGEDPSRLVQQGYLDAQVEAIGDLLPGLISEITTGLASISGTTTNGNLTKFNSSGQIADSGVAATNVLTKTASTQTITGVLNVPTPALPQ